MRIQDKARGVGFDRAHRDQVWAKVQEELGEMSLAEMDVYWDRAKAQER